MVERDYPQANRPEEHNRACQAVPAEHDSPRSAALARTQKTSRWSEIRHQHRAGRYYLDFYCYEASLCVEVDGEIHGRGDQPERDAIRDDWLRSQNVRVLRINASDVLRDMEAVLFHIVTIARG